MSALEDKNIVYCGDCERVLKAIGDNSIDLVVTSPPYDDLRKYKDNSGKEWCFEKFKAIAIELIRVLKNGGVIVWNVNDRVKNGTKSGTSFRQCLFFMDNGLNLNDTMILKKKNPMPQVKQPRYTQCYEYMFVFSKGKPKTFNPIMIPTKCGGQHYKSTAKLITDDNDRRELDYHVNKEMVDYNIWEMAVARNQDPKLKHPAVFPYELPLRHIKSWTNEGDTVLDPFCGSGTTLRAARDLKRNFIGIDCVDEYALMSALSVNCAVKKA